MNEHRAISQAPKQVPPLIIPCNVSHKKFPLHFNNSNPSLKRLIPSSKLFKESEVEENTLLKDIIRNTFTNIPTSTVAIRIDLSPPTSPRSESGDLLRNGFLAPCPALEEFGLESDIKKKIPIKKLRRSAGIQSLLLIEDQDIDNIRNKNNLLQSPRINPHHFSLLSIYDSFIAFEQKKTDTNKKQRSFTNLLEVSNEEIKKNLSCVGLIERSFHFQLITAQECEFIKKLKSLAENILKTEFPKECKASAEEILAGKAQNSNGVLETRLIDFFSGITHKILEEYEKFRKNDLFDKNIKALFSEMIRQMIKKSFITLKNPIKQKKVLIDNYFLILDYICIKLFREEIKRSITASINLIEESIKADYKSICFKIKAEKAEKNEYSFELLIRKIVSPELHKAVIRKDKILIGKITKTLASISFKDINIELNCILVQWNNVVNTLYIFETLISYHQSVFQFNNIKINRLQDTIFKDTSLNFCSDAVKKKKAFEYIQILSNKKTHVIKVEELWEMHCEMTGFLDLEIKNRALPQLLEKKIIPDLIRNFKIAEHFKEILSDIDIKQIAMNIYNSQYFDNSKSIKYPQLSPKFKNEFLEYFDLKHLIGDNCDEYDLNKIIYNTLADSTNVYVSDGNEIVDLRTCLEKCFQAFTALQNKIERISSTCWEDLISDFTCQTTKEAQRYLSELEFKKFILLYTQKEENDFHTQKEVLAKCIQHLTFRVLDIFTKPGLMLRKQFNSFNGQLNPIIVNKYKKKIENCLENPIVWSGLFATLSEIQQYHQLCVTSNLSLIKLRQVVRGSSSELSSTTV